jgi:ketosteroid isomerase-like protein
VRPADVVQQLFDAFARRDLEAALALLAADVELWPQGTAQRAGRDAPYRGHDGIRQYFVDVASVWETLAVEPGELRVVAGGVVAFGNARGRGLDGSELDAPVIWVFKLQDGLVTSARVTDTAPA